MTCKLRGLCARERAAKCLATLQRLSGVTGWSPVYSSQSGRQAQRCSVSLESSEYLLYLSVTGCICSCKQLKHKPDLLSCRTMQAFIELMHIFSLSQGQKFCQRPVWHVISPSSCGFKHLMTNFAFESKTLARPQMHCTMILREDDGGFSS